MCAGPLARQQGACTGLLDLGQIPNKRDENGTIIDFPNERMLARSEKDIREFDAKIERASPRDLKGREVRIAKDTPPLIGPAVKIGKRQSAAYRLQLCEHMDYTGRCASLPAPFGVCRKFHSGSIRHRRLSLTSYRHYHRRKSRLGEFCESCSWWEVHTLQVQNPTHLTDEIF